MPRHEGENQIGERKEQLVCHRTVPLCKVGPPKVIELEEAKSQSKKVIKLTKVRITELIGDPDLLR